MVKNRDLSKKVLVSLLTMSCVYLGGTFVIPTADAKSGENFTANEYWITNTANNYGVKISGSDITTDGDLVSNGNMLGAHGGNITTYKSINLGSGTNQQFTIYTTGLSTQAAAVKIDTGGTLNIEDTLTINNGYDGKITFGAANARGYGAGIWLADGILNAKNININANISSNTGKNFAQLSGLESTKGGFNITGDVYINTVSKAKSVSGLNLNATARDNIFAGNITVDKVDTTYSNGLAYGVKLNGTDKENKFNGVTEIKEVTGTADARGVYIESGKSTFNALKIGTVITTDTKASRNPTGLDASASNTDLIINKLVIDTVKATMGQAHGVKAFATTLNNAYLKIDEIEIKNVIGSDSAIGIYTAKNSGSSTFNNVTLKNVQAGVGGALGIDILRGDTVFGDINIEKVSTGATTQGPYGGVEATGIRFGYSYNGTANVLVNGNVHVGDVLADSVNAYGIRTLGEGKQVFSKEVQIDSVKGNIASGISIEGKDSEWNNVTINKVEAVNSIATGIDADGANSGLEDNEVHGIINGDVIVREINGNLNVSNVENAAIRSTNTATLDIRGGVKINLAKKSVNMEEALIASEGGKLSVNSGIARDVQINGDIKGTGTNSELNLKLATATSFLEGKSTAENAGKVNMAIVDGVWNMTGNSTITVLDNNALLDMRADNNAYSTLTAENLKGSGGVIKQDIDVRSMESDKVLVTGDFSGSQALDIYQKDNYVPASDSTEGTGLVLASVNGNGTFTAKDREGTLFYTHYDLANKASETEGFTTDWYLNKIIKTNESTTSVDTVLSANALNYHTWRTENDKLLQRMGELRHNGEEEQGAWFRVKGSKIGRDGKFGFENKYTAYELGYDQVTKRTADKTRYQGVGLSYTDGSSSYSKGSGDNSSKAISFYNTEIGSKGHYLDLVFKISNMDNDFTVYDTNSNKITGDFKNTGVSLSAEYGRKNSLQNGWYIEPQAQFTLGYLGGDSYTTSNGINVDQSGIKSAVGRIGFNIGKEVGNKGMVYAKANLLHEFGGGYDVTMRDSTGRVKVSDSFDDTWFEYGLGAALTTGKSSHIYFDVERSTGSDFKKDWQWNVGARWSF